MTRLVALMMAYVFALIDATLLPRACRKQLKATFAALFVRLEAKLIAIVQQPATITPDQPKPITTPAVQPAKPQAQAHRPRTNTTPIPASAPRSTSAHTKKSPTEAPQATRAPVPNHPTRAPSRAVDQSPDFAPTTPQKFQKPASTTPFSHAHFVTISQ